MYPLSELLSITWWQFEEVAAAMFRRLGYHEVIVLRSRGADAGVDIRMRREAKRCVVQCRHYPPTERISVDAVRAFAFVALKEKADEAIFITTGRFSAPCHVTAGDSPIPMILIDGQACMDLVLDVTKSSPSAPAKELHVAAPTGLAIPIGARADFACPSCGGDIVRKFDSKRSVAFWGCRSYPKCRFAAYDAPDPSDTKPRCLMCGGAMVRRDGKYGEFWGCTGYPACRGTRLLRAPALIGNGSTH